MSEEDKKSKRGFASFSEAKQKAARKKSAETRAAKKLLREENTKKAESLRETANELCDKAEMLRQQADELDGLCSSTKLKKKQDAVRAEGVETKFRGTVSSQYLSILVAYAIQRGLDADELVTPTFAYQDILQDPRATPKDRLEARKALQQYENAKPSVKEEDEVESVGSFQDELDALMKLHADISPKR